MCQGRLKPGGMLTLHLGSPVYQPETVRKNAANLRKVFKHVAPLSLFIPLYGSQWCLAVASDTDRSARHVSVETIAQRMANGRSTTCASTTRRCIRRCSRCRASRRSLTAPPPGDDGARGPVRAA